MTNLRLAYVDRFVDRHGKVRHYFRRPGGRRTALPGAPGSPEFMETYQAALGGTEPARRPRGPSAAAGTWQRLIDDYFASSDFLRLRATTRESYFYLMGALVRDHGLGGRPVREFRREHVKAILAKRAAKPGSANNALRCLRILIKFAIAEGWRADDPAAGVKKFQTGTYHTWTDDEIAAFEARWPIGTRERTAMALLLFTGQRLSDVVAMSKADVTRGRIRVAQVKTGAKLVIPVHPELAAVLERWSFFRTVLTKANGMAMSSHCLSSAMASAIEAAGLPQRCVAHGLRKAAARMLAEAGCTTKQIASITGHRTLSEVERYTVDAEQEGLAEAAIVKLSERRKR